MNKNSKNSNYSNKNIINAHCTDPYLVKRKDGKWSVRIKYKHDSITYVKEYIEKLNSHTLIADKKRYASNLISVLEEKLQTEYFNPHLKKFEKINKSEYPVLHFLNDFLLFKKHNISSGTLDDYKRVFKSFKSFLEETGKTSISLNDINKVLISDYLNLYLLNSGVSKSTRDYHLSVLKIYFNYLTDIKEILDKNPLKSLQKAGKGKSDKHKPYKENELQALLNHSKEYCFELYVLMVMQYYTLSRPTELLRLQAKNFDIINRRIFFGGDIIKTSHQKDIYINDALNQFLHSLNIDWVNIPSDHHFLGNLGKPRKRGSKTELRLFGQYQTGIQIYQNKFFLAKKKLKLDSNHTLYGIKHTGAIKLIDLGFHPLKIMHLTGHKSLDTFQTYIRDLKDIGDTSIKRTDIIF